MKQKTLLQLVPPHQESDYLEHFASLAMVNVEIREKGATAERLLRKSILEMDIGNYSAALDAARDASDVRLDWAEAHYQEGMSLLLLAFSKAGILAGAAAMERPVGSVRTLLVLARDSLRLAMDLNPLDEEVAEDYEALLDFTTAHDEDADLVAALQGLSVG